MKNFEQFKINVKQLKSVYGGDRPRATSIDTSGLERPIEPVGTGFDTDLIL
ncbi:hypothetical protein [Aquimarina aquimarini]|uniref:hypothetical protein n=1 Tax=Aquimarina aquimarini TaxID=1191734 RepID=UPI001F1A061A|nr:hypothetical protein [Aquimarina aquimarini]